MSKVKKIRWRWIESPTGITPLVRFRILFGGLILNASSCSESDQNSDCLPVTTDQSVNLDEFLGLWYELGGIPLVFNTGCSCTTAEYTLSTTSPGQVTVNNSCDRFAFGSVEGFAYAPDPNDFSKLKVKFTSFPSPTADYWVLYFNNVDGHMLVGSPTKSSLYILSRTNSISSSDYQGMLSIAEDMCYDISKVEKTDHTDCTYN